MDRHCFVLAHDFPAPMFVGFGLSGDAKGRLASVSHRHSGRSLRTRALEGHGQERSNARPLHQMDSRRTHLHYFILYVRLNRLKTTTSTKLLKLRKEERERERLHLCFGGLRGVKYSHLQVTMPVHYTEWTLEERICITLFCM